MRILCRPFRILLVLHMLLLAGSSSAHEAEPRGRSVEVLGKRMQLRAAGLERRTNGEPVVVLEAGLGNTSESWGPIFDRIAAAAPVVAYDRRAMGGSEPDSTPPTPEHSARVLRELLRSAGIAPPYVLVGHSWGGPLIRMFAAKYPETVSGLVFLDATEWETTLEQRTKVFRDAGASDARIKEILTPPTLPSSPDFPPGKRAEGTLFFQLQGSGELTRIFAALPPLGPIPVSVVIAGRRGERRAAPAPVKAGEEDARAVRLGLYQLKLTRQTEMARNSPHGLVIISSEAGHLVYRDAPDLTMQAIEYVLAKARPQPKPAAKE